MDSNRPAQPLSIVISTVGRPYFLAALIASLELYAPKGSEIIVINNRSDSSRIETAEAERLLLKIQSQTDLRFLTMTERGLSAARNFGVHNSKFDVVHFLDDECLVTKETYSGLTDFRNSGDSLGFGGYISLRLEAWHKYDLTTQSLQQHINPSQTHLKNMVAGGNLFVLKDEFIKLGGFREDLGRGSRNIEVGEDTEFAQRVIDSGSGLFFMRESTVLHGERPSRNRLWGLKNFFHVGRLTAFTSLQSVGNQKVRPQMQEIAFYKRLKQRKLFELIFIFMGYCFQWISTRNNRSKEKPAG